MAVKRGLMVKQWFFNIIRYNFVCCVPYLLFNIINKWY